MKIFFISDDVKKPLEPIVPDLVGNRYIFFIVSKALSPGMVAIEIEDDDGVKQRFENNDVVVIFKNKDDKLLLSERLVEYRKILKYSGIFEFHKQALLSAVVIERAASVSPESAILELNVLHQLVSKSTVLEFALETSNVFSTVSLLLLDPAKHVLVCPDAAQRGHAAAVKDANSFLFTLEESVVCDYPLKLSSERYFEKAKEDETDTLPVMSWDAFQAKHAMTFDTLIVNCSNVLSHTLASNDSILESIQTIVCVNNYKSFDEVRAVLVSIRKKGFGRIYRGAFGGGPCHDCFFEIYVRHSTT